MKLGKAVALAILVGSSGAYAQPTGADAFEKELDALFVPGGLTADAAAKRAKHASPAVRKAVASIDVSIESAKIAELVRVPQIGGTIGYSRLSPVDPLVFPPNPPLEIPTNNFTYQASIALQLSDYVWRYPRIIKGARLGIEAARAGKQASEIDAGHEARLAYYEWVRAKLQVMIADRTLAQVRSTLKQVRALADAQRLSKADLMRVESGEAQSEQVLDQLKNLAFLREEQLRLLIGADERNEKLAMGEDIRAEVAAPGAAPLDDVMTTAMRQRREFIAFDTGIQAKKYQQDAERAGQLPRLSAFAQVDWARPNSRIFPLKDEFNLTWVAGLQLTWTINETLVTRANVRRFGAEVRELEADRENLVRGTRLEVLAAQQAVDLAQKSLSTTRKGLAAAEESYRVRQALLAADRATAVELVDAETELARARIAALNARIDLRVALALLGHAVGSDSK